MKLNMWPCVSKISFYPLGYCERPIYIIYTYYIKNYKKTLMYILFKFNA